MLVFLTILGGVESHFLRRFLRLFDMISSYRDKASPNHENELMLFFGFECELNVNPLQLGRTI